MREGKLERPGATLRFVDSGVGPPMLFQHGLGGDAAQVAEVSPTGFRVLTLECRAHGGSNVGPPDLLSLATFADDVLALADQLRIPSFVLGGISMGAAIATRVAALHPRRVEALVLVRPAWLFAPAPDNMRAFAMVAEFLRDAPAKARRRFVASDLARQLATDAPDNLASLVGFFDRPNPATTAQLLGRLAVDGPGVDASDVTAPALVVGNAVDHVHPLALARQLAAALPNGRFVEVPAKATDRAAHVAAVRAAIETFRLEQTR